MSYTSGYNGCDELLIPLVGIEMFWMLFSSILMGLGGISVYVYYHRKGQFEDPEDVKYQMFREEKKDKE
jgi:nitrogen fixation-related uncharacterized protein